VVDDAIAPGDIGAKHRLDLRRRIAAMRAGGDEDRHIAGADVRHLLEECLEHLAARLRAGDVADRNRHAAAAARQLAQRRRADW